MELISKKGFDFFCNSDFVFFIEQDENSKDIFFKTDLETTCQISIDEYTNIKFGKAGRTLVSPYCECIQLNNGEYLTCIFYDSIIFRHDSEGNKIKEYKIGHFQTGFDITYSIAIDRNGNLWIAQPTSHYIGQFSLDTEKELFRIGGDYENPGILNYPEQVRVFEDYVFVCDMGNKRICKLDIKTKELTEYKKFNDPIFEYGQFKTKEIVRLTSGLYQL